MISREALMVLVGAKSWVEKDLNSKFEDVMGKYCKTIAKIEAKIERKFSINKDLLAAHNKLSQSAPTTNKSKPYSGIENYLDGDQ